MVNAISTQLPHNRKKQTLFVLVKPDGMDNLEKIKEMFLGAFLKKGELASLEFEKLLPKGSVEGRTIVMHYDKTTKWLTKYGHKILEARLGIHAKKDDWIALQVGKSIPEALVNYMTSDTMCAMIFSSYSENTFDIARKILGDVDPSKADMDSIRGMFSKDSFISAWTEELGPRAIQNVCHCSDSEIEAFREACVFFDGHDKSIVDKYFPELAKDSAQD